MNRNTKISALLLAAGLATAGTLAFAKANENDAVTDLAKAKISLSQAITAAEAALKRRVRATQSAATSAAPSRAVTQQF